MNTVKLATLYFLLMVLTGFTILVITRGAILSLTHSLSQKMLSLKSLPLLVLVISNTALAIWVHLILETLESL